VWGKGGEQGRRSEIRDQRSEIRGQGSEVRGQRFAIGLRASGFTDL
jgi:hypothetical protein